MPCVASFLPLIRQKSKIFATFPPGGKLVSATPVNTLHFDGFGVLCHFENRGLQKQTSILIPKA